MSLSYGLRREHERPIAQLTHFFYRARYTAKLSTLREKRFLSSHQQAVQRDLKAALYSCWFSVREKWRQGGQQPCSQHRVYPAKLHVCVHMAQYIWLREHTRTRARTQTHTHSPTYTHTYTFVMWIHGTIHSGGEWMMGGHSSPWKLLVNPLCAVRCLTVCLQSLPLPLPLQLGFRVWCFLGSRQEHL